VLMGLSGVGLPMASAILTAIDQDRYTVIDYRALQALGASEVDPDLNFYLGNYHRHVSDWRLRPMSTSEPSTGRYGRGRRRRKRKRRIRSRSSDPCKLAASQAAGEGSFDV
jgi:hypothetical protein